MQAGSNPPGADDHDSALETGRVLQHALNTTTALILSRLLFVAEEELPHADGSARARTAGPDRRVAGGAERTARAHRPALCPTRGAGAGREGPRRPAGSS